MKELKNYKKIFTNDKCNNIMKKKYSPFIVNSKKYLRKKGLSMKDEEDIILKEMQKDLTLEERKIVKLYFDVCMKLYKKGIEKGFNAKL